MKKLIKKRLEEISTNKINCVVKLTFTTNAMEFNRDIKTIQSEIENFGKEFSIVSKPYGINNCLICVDVQWRDETSFGIEIR